MIGGTCGPSKVRGMRAGHKGHAWQWSAAATPSRPGLSTPSRRRRTRIRCRGVGCGGGWSRWQTWRMTSRRPRSELRWMPTAPARPQPGRPAQGIPREAMEHARGYAEPAVLQTRTRLLLTGPARVAVKEQAGPPDGRPAGSRRRRMPGIGQGHKTGTTLHTWLARACNRCPQQVPQVGAPQADRRTAYHGQPAGAAPWRERRPGPAAEPSSGRA